MNGVSSATRHLNVLVPASSAFMRIGSSSEEMISAAVSAVTLHQSMDWEERNLLVPLYEGIPSPSTENFCWLNDDPFAKMDDRRKPNVLFIGVPLSFLAPAALRVARRLNFFIDSEQMLEKLSILRQKTINSLLFFCSFLSTIFQGIIQVSTLSISFCPPLQLTLLFPDCIASSFDVLVWLLLC